MRDVVDASDKVMNLPVMTLSLTSTGRRNASATELRSGLPASRATQTTGLAASSTASGAAGTARRRLRSAARRVGDVHSCHSASDGGQQARGTRARTPNVRATSAPRLSASTRARERQLQPHGGRKDLGWWPSSRARGPATTPAPARVPTAAGTASTIQGTSPSAGDPDSSAAAVLITVTPPTGRAIRASSAARRLVEPHAPTFPNLLSASRTWTSMTGRMPLMACLAVV